MSSPGTLFPGALEDAPVYKLCYLVAQLYDNDFSSASQWMLRENPALSGRAPVDMLRLPQDQAEIFSHLERLLNELHR